MRYLRAGFANPPPSGRREQTMRGTTGPASVRSPRNAKADRYRVARRVGVAHPQMRQASAIRAARAIGPSGEIRTTRLLGAPLPLDWGEEERGKTGEPPRPSKGQGPHSVGLASVGLASPD